MIGAQCSVVPAVMDRLAWVWPLVHSGDEILPAGRIMSILDV